MQSAIWATIRDYYRKTFWLRQNAITEYHPGYVLNYSGNRYLSGANQLWIDDPACVDARLADQAVRFFRQFRADWTIFTLPTLHPQLKAFWMRFGGRVLWSNPLMMLKQPPQISLDVSSVVVRRAVGQQARAAAYRIVCEAFQMADDPHQRMFHPDHDDDPTIQHYLAFDGQTAAAVATLHGQQALGGVWNVGTLPQHRQRGLAHALMAHLLADAQHLGYKTTILLASHQGHRMYRRMGYEQIDVADYLTLPMY